MVGWESFLPRMALRVLLVEADDSTRQIIAALLRKCSYKVAAVSDGLKAWEVLKRRPQDIDLILTEVELPSISGFALLTLIMEHESCKNIPVIMMSSQDSISTVYNCMLRGAADFLVKPIRRNELGNLWQHVWRRQSSTIDRSASAPQDESVAQQKVEASAENNGASCHSSACKASVQINKECAEIESNSQSSCTKPDMGAESTYMENIQYPSQPQSSRSGQELVTQENDASAVASDKEDNSMFWVKDVEQEGDREDPHVTDKAADNYKLRRNSCKEAIDLIGAFDSNSQFSDRISGSGVVQEKFDYFPLLDLSLRRSNLCGSENKIADEKQTIHHSDSSAFSRYINRTSPPFRPEPTCTFYQDKENGVNSDKNLHDVSGYNSDASCLTLNARRSVSPMPTADHFRQAEATISCSQERVIPVTVPVRSINLDSFSAGSGPIRLPEESTLPPIQSENGGSNRIFEPFPKASNLDNLNRHQEDQKLVSVDRRGQFSTAADQTGSSSFCNGTSNHLSDNIGCRSVCGSNGSANPVVAVRNGLEGGNEEGLSAFDRNSHRSTQREAALNKFRLKRKDRCFEKKVRYESRKKLAEQRPRVKGQFVRQAPVNPSAC